MRLPKRGERGFTLIELLIVVAILGVLAAVIIPNVTRFVGAGKQEAAETELHNVQLAVTSMMLENGITSIPNPLDVNGPGAEQTNQMGGIDLDPAGGDGILEAGFPDYTSDWTATPGGKVTDPDGGNYGTGDQTGYVLYGHDITAGDGDLVNYVTVEMTTYYYTCQADGTVEQWDVNGAALVWD